MKKPLTYNTGTVEQDLKDLDPVKRMERRRREDRRRRRRERRAARKRPNPTEKARKRTDLLSPEQRRRNTARKYVEMHGANHRSLRLPTRWRVSLSGSTSPRSLCHLVTSASWRLAT